MPTYRNTNTGHEHTTDAPDYRLDRMDNWERIDTGADQEPQEPAVAPVSPAPAPESTDTPAEPVKAPAKKAPARKTAAKKTTARKA